MLGWIAANTRAPAGTGFSGGVDGFDPIQTRLTWASTEQMSISRQRRVGTAAAVVTQTGFGMKPYSTLFGALKVADEVSVSLAAKLPTA